MTPEPDYLLDSSAILAVIFQEPGADFVLSILPNAAISAVNLAEVVTKLGKYLTPPHRFLQMLKLLNVPVLAWDEGAAMDSLRFAHLAKQGLSLGDRACITEGMRRPNAKMVTADRSGKKVSSIESRVALIR